MTASTELRTRDILIAARALIEKPEQWTQGAYQRDARGKNCIPQEAVCRCAAAAIAAVLYNGEDWLLAGELLQPVIGTWDVEDWNDAPGRTHAEVLAAFDRAIELAETAQ